jgi:prophage regulatory protein
LGYNGHMLLASPSLSPHTTVSLWKLSTIQLLKRCFYLLYRHILRCCPRVCPFSNKARTGRSRSSIYADVQAGLFPAPIKIGPCAVGWLESEVEAWLARQIEQSRKAVKETHVPGASRLPTSGETTIIKKCKRGLRPSCPRSIPLTCDSLLLRHTLTLHTFHPRTTLPIRLTLCWWRGSFLGTGTHTYQKQAGDRHG